MVCSLDTLRPHPKTFKVSTFQRREDRAMTDRELHRLKRAELLDLLLTQQEELERLREELAQTRAALEDRNLRKQEAGSIAEAALAVTAIFEQAQKAADLYLENIRLAAGAPETPEELPAVEAEEAPTPVKPRSRRRQRKRDES